MHVVVAYATHQGSTQGIAERIADTLRREGMEAELRSVQVAFDPSADVDAYVIGSAVHAGHWLKPAKQFVERHAESLEKRPVWLFSSGPIGEKAVHQPQPEPAEIPRFRDLVKPREHVVFAGAFDRSVADAKGGVLGRAINRFIPEGDFRDWPAIEGWARGIANELSGELATA